MGWDLPWAQFRLAVGGLGRSPLERIAVDWNREAVAINRVNPLDLDSVDQIHVVGGSPQAIPTEHDLVYGGSRLIGTARRLQSTA